jgi:hypothetical protein
MTAIWAMPATACGQFFVTLPGIGEIINYST